MPANLFLIHGNDPAALAEARYQLLRKLLPNGEEDGEIIDIHPPGNQPLQLAKTVSQINEELGAVSLVPDQRRVVVVWNLAELRSSSSRSRGRKKAAKKASKRAAAADPVDRLAGVIDDVLDGSGNALVFIVEEDDERGRRVVKTAPAYELIRRRGRVQECSERRIDWQWEEALLGGNLAESIRILRRWDDRGGSGAYRIVTTLDGVLQLLLQARLRLDAQAHGIDASRLFPRDMRPSIDSVPDFKRRKVQALAAAIPLDALRDALAALNRTQKAFFPTGDELIVHDAIELLEFLLADLFSSIGRRPA